MARAKASRLLHLCGADDPPTTDEVPVMAVASIETGAPVLVGQQVDGCEIFPLNGKLELWISNRPGPVINRIKLVGAV